MLTTIAVEIDDKGYVHPLEASTTIPSGRAYLTLLPDSASIPIIEVKKGNAAQALELLASSRFANRPVITTADAQQHIDALRNDWSNR